MEGEILTKLLETGGNNVFAIIAIYMIHQIKLELIELKTRYNGKSASHDARLKQLENKVK